MNCLYITLFFNKVTGIVQTFIKSWNQLMYPRVIEVCRLPLGRQRPKMAYRSFVRREHQSPWENSRHHFVTFCQFITLP
jgi:hypothetical protein